MFTPVTAVVLMLSTAPEISYDRFEDQTIFVEKWRGMRLLIAVGVELHVAADGTSNGRVRHAKLRFWQTLSDTSSPFGIVGAQLSGSRGGFLVDGKRVGSVSCADFVVKDLGYFRTWSRDVTLDDAALRALAHAKQSVELRCGRAEEKIDGEALRRFVALAGRFRSELYDDTPVIVRRPPRTFEHMDAAADDDDPGAREP